MASYKKVQARVKFKEVERKFSSSVDNFLFAEKLHHISLISKLNKCRYFNIIYI